MCMVRKAVMVSAVLALATLPFAVAQARQAKPKSSAADQAQTAAQDAEASLDKARRALDDGKPQTAEQLADAILVSDKKDARNTARALAIRGEAHLQLGRPAEAISDLDSALWLKGGLAGRERDVASAARAKALQTGGVAGTGASIEHSHASTPAAAPSKRLSSPAAWKNTVTVASDEPATGTTTKEQSNSGSSGGGISGFFSNLFGGGQSASRQSESTGAVQAPPPRMPAVSSSEPQRVGGPPPISHPPASSPTPRRGESATRVPPRRSAPAKAARGTFALQLAAVRTEAEAQTMAQKVRAQKGGALASRKVEIVENVYGNMGKFYRVRIGPFAEADQARSICDSLRAGRMDCVVIDPNSG